MGSYEFPKRSALLRNFCENSQLSYLYERLKGSLNRLGQFRILSVVIWHPQNLFMHDIGLLVCYFHGVFLWKRQSIVLSNMVGRLPLRYNSAKDFVRVKAERNKSVARIVKKKQKKNKKTRAVSCYIFGKICNHGNC